jgi:hypothetical protein
VSDRQLPRDSSQGEIARIEDIVQAFMNDARALTDGDLAYVALMYDNVDVDASPGTFLWQQLALTELACRRASEGKR